jgi:hypothetical protein
VTGVCTRVQGVPTHSGNLIAIFWAHRNSPSVLQIVRQKVTVAKSALLDTRLVCEYCGLESAVSHASTRECISGLQREAVRLRDNMLHGRGGDHAAGQPPFERTIRSLSLVGSNR